MKNPLNKRYFRELKNDFGKYIALCLFLIAVSYTHLDVYKRQVQMLGILHLLTVRRRL